MTRSASRRRRSRSAGASAVAVALALAGFGAPAAGQPTNVPARTVAASTACVPVAHWSTRRLAAQTVIVPVQETSLADADTEVAHGAGGVILFGSSAPTDLRSQVRALRRLVPDNLGLLVMADEEGGGVQRMGNLVGNLPWARDMARRWTPTGIRGRVARMATKMSYYGVNTDLAPVVDVDGRNVPPGPTDPDGWRSFSGRTSVVTADGTAYLRGLRDGGVMPVLKHFPGLGGASGNTDYGPARTLPWSTLRTVALPPFVAGIRAGVPAIMISNASVPGLTRQPAALSAAVIRHQLVGVLGFRGLIVTDSLSAGAIAQAGFQVPRAAVHALRAGAHMIMYNAATPADAQATFSAVVAAEIRAVAQGTLTRGVLVAAARAALTARHVLVCR